VSAFCVKLGANDLNSVDLPLNPILTHSESLIRIQDLWIRIMILSITRKIHSLERVSCPITTLYVLLLILFNYYFYSPNNNPEPYLLHCDGLGHERSSVTWPLNYSQYRWSIETIPLSRAVAAEILCVKHLAYPRWKCIDRQKCFRGKIWVIAFLTYSGRPWNTLFELVTTTVGLRGSLRSVWTFPLKMRCGR